MKEKMLFITTQFPYPLDNGGKIGAFNGLSVVSRDYDVTVLSFSEEPQFVEEGIAYYEKQLAGVHFCKPVIHDVHIRNHPIKLFRALALGYVKQVPYIVSKFLDPEMYSLIDEIFSDGSYWNFVFIDYLNMWSYGEYIWDKYRGQVGHWVLKDHNVEYDLVKQEADAASLIKKAILVPEWKRTLRYEIHALKKAQLVFSVCDPNSDWMKRYNSSAQTMLPTYSMIEAPVKNSGSTSILYMGNLSWKSNMDGLRWFVDNVFDMVLEKLPNVRLKIVGSGPAENPFSSKANVDYMGYVKDISNIYEDQAAFIVPLFEGSGIRIKILEAFNNEIAVVSTSLGCETIGATDGEHLLVADTAEQFADAVIKLVSDGALNEKIRQSGKKLLREKFSLQSRQQEFRKIVDAAFGETDQC